MIRVSVVLLLCAHHLSSTSLHVAIWRIRGTVQALQTDVRVRERVGPCSLADLGPRCPLKSKDCLGSTSAFRFFTRDIATLSLIAVVIFTNDI